MCINPSLLQSGSLVPCRNCWQCREDRTNDWVGRCIAETKTATAANFVTLTYGRDDEGQSDHIRARVLTYSDVQKFFKRLRRSGYAFKYFVVGEYGSAKGRAHWHALMFWRGRKPPTDTSGRAHITEWPHGHVDWDEVNTETARYVCKYLTKDAHDVEAQAIFHMSKRTPLGAEYFQQLAGRYVENGLSPQDLYYSFPESRNAAGKLVRYYLTGASAELYLKGFISQWRQRHGNDNWPGSELIEAYLDKKAGKTIGQIIGPKREYGHKPIAAPEGAQIRFSDIHNAYYADTSEGRLYWSWTEQGDKTWQSVIKGRPEPTDTIPRNRGE